ncbi:NAD-dependent succinate-semialdehyde dehydrogenase [Candidatus Puniceispirillum sp.]|nr:NAD-dependent succinate-semialdehyde dehydrogenase [Candidatus Puniceispirillum sp.]
MKLKDPSLLRSQAYINGAWIDAADGRVFAVNNPADGGLIAKVADLGADSITAAIDAAVPAQKAWAATPAKTRAMILRRWYDLVIENTDDLATILTTEMGKPLAEAKGEIAYGASFIDWFGEEARRVCGDVMESPQADKRLLTFKQPIGVFGAITPWNFPIAMITRKVAPGIAAGCACVLKPAEQTPLSALALAELATRAGIPAGVMNIVTGLDAPAIGQALCADSRIRKMTFTGSTEVGRILMRQSADSVKKMSLELGGNAPLLVFDDANLDVAVEGAMLSKYRNAGQTCVCANRIFVQDGIYDEFAKRLAKKSAAMKVGNGLDAGVEQGPLIDQQGFDKVTAHVDDALAKGATALVGGKPHELGGTYYEPTVLTNMNASMRMFREETFGPVAGLFRFTDEAEAIQAANDTEFGLAAYLFTENASSLFRVSEALEYGIVAANTGIFSSEVGPFGGVKNSGLGREGSKYGIDEFLEIKFVCIGL